MQALESFDARGEVAPPMATDAASTRHQGTRLWTVTREDGSRHGTAQLPDEARAIWFQRTLGLTVVEVAQAYR